MSRSLSSSSTIVTGSSSTGRNDKNDMDDTKEKHNDSNDKINDRYHNSNQHCNESDISTSLLRMDKIRSMLKNPILVRNFENIEKSNRLGNSDDREQHGLIINDGDDTLKLSSYPWKLLLPSVKGNVDSKKSNDEDRLLWLSQTYLQLRQRQNLTFCDLCCREGVGYAKQHLFAMAESQFQKALAVMPTHAETLVAYGATCGNTQQYEKAISLLDKVIDMKQKEQQQQQLHDNDGNKHHSNYDNDCFAVDLKVYQNAVLYRKQIQNKLNINMDQDIAGNTNITTKGSTRAAQRYMADALQERSFFLDSEKNVEYEKNLNDLNNVQELKQNENKCNREDGHDTQRNGISVSEGEDRDQYKSKKRRRQSHDTKGSHSNDSGRKGTRKKHRKKNSYHLFDESGSSSSDGDENDSSSKQHKKRKKKRKSHHHRRKERKRRKSKHRKNYSSSSNASDLESNSRDHPTSESLQTQQGKKASDNEKQTPPPPLLSANGTINVSRSNDHHVPDDSEQHRLKHIESTTIHQERSDHGSSDENDNSHSYRKRRKQSRRRKHYKKRKRKKMYYTSSSSSTGTKSVSSNFS